jgi:hypothetical protein
MIEDQTIQQLIEQEMEKLFIDEVVDQRELVEKECNVLQTLIDSETGNISTSFLWCSNKRKLIITDDIFRRKRKFRQVVNDDNDSDSDEQDFVRLKFELKSPDGSKSSLPLQTMTFEIDDSSQSDVPENNVPKNNVKNI